MKKDLTEILPFKYSVVNEGIEGKPFIVAGRFQMADVLNGNGRVYPRAIWERVLANEKLKEALSHRRVLGEMDHPESGKTSLRNASHVITKIELRPNGEIYGEAEIFDNSDGKRLQEYFRRGIEVGISSRGSGSVKESEWQGEAKAEIVQDDYELKTYDFVSDPSTPMAYPTVISEEKDNLPENKAEDTQLTMQELTEKIKSISASVNLVEKAIKPGCDYSELSNKLIEVQVEASRLSTEPGMKEAVEDITKTIKQTKAKLETVKTSDPRTIEGLERQLAKANSVINELVRRYRLKESDGEKVDKMEAQKFTRALFRTLRAVPLAGLSEGENNMTDEEIASVEQLEADNEELSSALQRTQREALEWKKNYFAAGALAEALALVARNKQRKNYVENLMRGRNDSSELVPLLLEGNKSIPTIASRFKYLTQGRAAVELNGLPGFGNGGNNGSVRVLREDNNGVDRNGRPANFESDVAGAITSKLGWD